jgi:hypothetical protein
VKKDKLEFRRMFLFVVSLTSLLTAVCFVCCKEMLPPWNRFTGRRPSVAGRKMVTNRSAPPALDTREGSQTPPVIAIHMSDGGDESYASSSISEGIVCKVPTADSPKRVRLAPSGPADRPFPSSGLHNTPKFGRQGSRPSSITKSLAEITKRSSRPRGGSLKEHSVHRGSQSAPASSFSLRSSAEAAGADDRSVSSGLASCESSPRGFASSTSERLPPRGNAQ